MTFDKLNRRTHLYGALALLPWFLMYGASSYPFAHPGGHVEWKVRFEREYAPAAAPGASLDDIGGRVARDMGVGGRHGAYRDPSGNLQIYCSRFTGPSRITYFEKEHRVLVEDQKFNLSSFLTGMHTRGGFERGGLLDGLWAVLVDCAALAVVIWVVSGIYMWWRLRHLRLWGSVALGAGLASFAVFLLAL